MITNTPILNVRDISSGQMGSIWVTFPNGKRMCMAHAKEIQTNIDYDKEQVGIMGKTQKANRKTGETYSGSMSVYKVESQFRKYAYEYKNLGTDLYFDIQVESGDPTARNGSEVITYIDCNLDNLMLSVLNVDNTILEEDMDFTFEDWRLDQPYDELDYLFI